MTFDDANERVHEARSTGYRKASKLYGPKQMRQSFSLTSPSAARLRARARELGITPTRLLEQLVAKECGTP